MAGRTVCRPGSSSQHRTPQLDRVDSLHGLCTDKRSPPSKCSKTSIAVSYSSHKRANRATREHIARREHDVERGVWLGGDQSEASSCHRAKGLTRAYLVSVRLARAKSSSHQRPHGLRGESRTQRHNTSVARGTAKRTRECTLLQGPRHAPGRFDSIQGRMQAGYLGGACIGP